MTAVSEVVTGTPAKAGTAAGAGATAVNRLLPSDLAVAHTLLNCLVRELPEIGYQAAVVGGFLELQLPRCGTSVRVAVRRESVWGAHRFTGPVEERVTGRWAVIGWRLLAERVHAELFAVTGLPNEEFLDQVAASHEGVATALAAPRATATGDPLADYLGSERSLVYGHRFHPTPKARGGDADAWRDYAPETGAEFPLRMLAVRQEWVVEEAAWPGAASALDALGTAPPGYLLLPAHPWQYRILRGHSGLESALLRGDVLDLGPGPRFSPTASVRTLYDGRTFLKFSLNVRITNCLRKNADYELAGAVALTRLLDPVLAELTKRFPGSDMLREPAFRSVAVSDRSLLEGLGVIVREGLAERQQPGTTALLAAAVADEYPTGPGHISALLGDAGRDEALRWWGRFLRLLVPPVLAAYLDHGVVLEPHLQNVLVCVDSAGDPVQVLFRDLEGTKLLPGHHASWLRTLPAHVAGPLTYDADQGWNRVLYCLLVNHIAEMLAALADRDPAAESLLWAEVRDVLEECSLEHGPDVRLDALVRGAPLPGKQNLLARWRRSADKAAGFVRLASPWGGGGSGGGAELSPSASPSPSPSSSAVSRDAAVASTACGAAR